MLLVTLNYYRNSLKGSENVNIGIMQLSNSSINSLSVAKSQSAVASTQSTRETKSFGDVFNKAINASTKSETTSTIDSKAESVDVEKLDDLLNSQSIEEVLDLIGIPQDEGLLMLQDDQVVAMEELLSLDNLLSVLGIDQAQLMDTIKQLTDSEMEGSQDLWQLINGVLEQDTQIVQQLMTALQGEQKVTPKQAEQLLQFLKLAQVSGKSTDLFSEQAATLNQLNNMLKNVAAQASAQLTQTTETQAGKTSLQGFEQVVQKTVKTTEVVEKTETTVIPTASTTNTTKTITITLPTEKGAQSEALAKEIQNLLNRSQISNTPGMTKLLLKLYPENLGSIRIEIMQQDGVLSARLLTTTAMGKELLDSQLHQLKNAFANANIQMDRIDIAQSLQETDRNKDQNQFGQQFKQQSNQDNHEQDDHDEDSEKMSFNDYLINEEV